MLYTSNNSNRNVHTRKKGPGRIAGRGAYNQAGKKVIVSYRAIWHDTREIFSGIRELFSWEK